MKRILVMIPTMLVISFLVFFIIQLPPGDYISSYVAQMKAEGEMFTQEMINQLRVDFGLDKPWYIQYLFWMRGIILHWDFGYSFSFLTPVWDVISRYLPLTLIVSFITMAFTYIVSLPIGIYSANHQYSKGDYAFTFIGFLGMATPNFLLAIILMYLSYIWTGIPFVGLFSNDMLLNGIHFYNLLEFLGRMLVPVIVIGTADTCGIIRTVRSQMLDEKGKQYTLTARAKGVSEHDITYKYCLRSAINPVISGLSTSLSKIFTGSTISAIVMNLSILGPVLYTALLSQDMYLAGTILLVHSFLIVLGTLIADILLAVLDPRIRFDNKEE
jgi:peptide/nickel transport system permease protein